MPEAAVRPQSRASRDLRGGSLRALAAALRPHQWAKNLLVFSAPLFSHSWRSAASWLQALAAFAALSLCASALYLLNDVVDAASDALHPRKRLRPVASGALGRTAALAAAAILLVASALVASPMRRGFAAFLGAYVLLGLVYIFAGRRVPVLDVVVLALLYTLRILAGGAATGIPISAWLLGFSLFFFFSLALSKRASEMAISGGHAPGRPYEPGDPLASSGIASGYAALVVFALYLQSPETASLYRHPAVLWLIVPILLYWLTRLWILTTRGRMDEDAILFALKDPPSYCAAAAAVAVILFAL
jgi:4-hydroxybenzoate polyprenyltransferase